MEKPLARAALKPSIKRVLRPVILGATDRLGRFIKAVVGRHVIGLLADTPQGLFLVDPHDVGVGGALARRGLYGQDEIDRLKGLVSADDRVLFVGSHVGALVIPMAAVAKSVTAVEANPKTARLLRANVGLNDARNVEVVEIAASDRRSQIEFVLSKSNSGGSKRMPAVRAGNYFYDRPDVVKVDADRLDDVLPDRSFEVIVMDIEGSEYFALKGMPRLLRDARHLLVEYLPHHLKNVSGATPAQFLELIAPYFTTLYVPSKKLTADSSEFLPVLQSMYDKGEFDDGILFS